MSRLYTSVNFVELKALKMNLRRKSSDGFAIPTHYGHSWATYNGTFQSPTYCYSKSAKAIGYKVNKIYRLDFLIRRCLSGTDQSFITFSNLNLWRSKLGPLTNDAVQAINNFVNQREDLLSTSVEDLEKSLLLYLCWTNLKNFCPLTGKVKREEMTGPVESFLDRFEV